MREEYAQNVKISNIRNQVFLSFPKSELYISLSEEKQNAMYEGEQCLHGNTLKYTLLSTRKKSKRKHPTD